MRKSLRPLISPTTAVSASGRDGSVAFEKWISPFTRYWWISVANYKSATGNLTVLLTITLYLFITSSIFLLGAQLDELLRKKTRAAK